MSERSESSESGPIPESPDVSVIIVNWNLKELLRDCLQSVRDYGGDLSLETIVVDNASSDGSPETIQREFPWVRLIQNQDNVGFSRANNAAIEIARGRYFFLLNNDALLREGTLYRLVGFMDSHPEAGICGPRVINEDGSLQVRSKGRYPSIRTAAAHFFLPSFWQHRGKRSLGFYDNRDSMETRQLDWVSGCALMVRREAVNVVGLLDAEVFMYCEDVDWCYRMNHSGWEVYYVPQSVVLHYAGQSMKKQKGKVVGAHKKGLVSFYTKYHGEVAGFLFNGFLWVGYGVHAFGWVFEALRGRGAGWDKIKRVVLGLRSGTSK